MYRCNAFFVFGNLILDKNFLILGTCGATPSGVMVRPRKSTCLTPKWHLDMANFNPAFLMHLKTSRILTVSCVASLAAIPMSSTYCAHWSALMTGSKYSRMKLEKADRERLSPCASLLYAKVLLAKLNASI